MGIQIRNWLPHVIFAAFSTAVLVIMFLCNDMRYREAYELVDKIVEQNELDRKIDEGNLPSSIWGCDSGILLQALINKYGINGVSFILDQVNSDNNAKTALALRELQHLFFEDIHPYSEYKEKLQNEGMNQAKNMVISQRDTIAQLILSENHVIRQNAATLIALTGNPDCLFQLKKIINSNLPVEIRAVAVEALGWLPHKINTKTQGLLISCVKDKEPEIRRAAVCSLSLNAETKQVTNAQYDSNIRVQAQAVYELIFLRLGYDPKVALSALNSPLVDNKIRLEIAINMAFKGYKQTLPVLVAFFGNDRIVESYGIDVITHYSLVSRAISKIIGKEFGPNEKESLDSYTTRVKTDALEWWEKHKSEVLEESK